jgi:hypothetical protein
MKLLSADQVAQKAIAEYQRVIEDIQVVEEFLVSSGRLPLGTYVTKKTANTLDKMFGNSKGQIGMIVGWDFRYGYYRVYYSESNPFIGEADTSIELYEGEVPEELKSKDPYEVKSIYVKLGGNE